MYTFAFVTFFLTISKAALINKYDGNLRTANNIYLELVVQIGNNNNNEDSYEFTGAVVDKNYIITHEKVCKNVNQFDVKIKRYNNAVNRGQVKSMIFKYQICLIQLDNKFYVDPLEFRVYKHRLVNELPLQLYPFQSFELKQKNAITIEFKKAKSIFGNTAQEYTLGIKLDNQVDYNTLQFGSVIVYKKTKIDRLVGVIVDKKSTKEGFFALGIELNSKEVANFIKKETGGVVKFRGQK